MQTETCQNFDELVHERRNCIANALELRLSCNNPSICGLDTCELWGGLFLASTMDKQFLKHLFHWDNPVLSSLNAALGNQIYRPNLMVLSKFAIAKKSKRFRNT